MTTNDNIDMDTEETETGPMDTNTNRDTGTELLDLIFIYRHSDMDSRYNTGT